ncbi:MAG: VCBS repeat-containing protein [Solirubrobacteraceae bacterium]|nr:VCBS repeat-containing protein [Solirubrobacteraceae bacterium]
MRITGSEVALNANHQKLQYDQAATQVKVWHERRQQQPEPSAGAQWQPHDPPAEPPKVSKEDEAFQVRRQLWASDPLLARYIDVLERMFGVHVEILDPNDLTASGSSEVFVAAAQESPPPPTRASLAITVDLSRTRYEAEEVQFQAAGKVTTDDGRTIDLALQSKVSREFLEHSETHLAFGAAVQKQDPIVLNLSGLPAQLTDAKIEFDLNADGQLDRFHVLGEGSAYLIWDRNQDGVANDGTELFGPTTGDGFGELAAHDQDQNGWIDEGDQIYTQLALWGQTSGTTQSLSKAQVGAIYLGSVATPFTLTPGASEQARGEVRETGIFLREDGSAGTVQQLDLMA